MKVMDSLECRRAATRNGAAFEVFHHVRLLRRGARLNVGESGSVLAERRAMFQDPYVIDQAGRVVGVAAIQRHCAHRGWNLLAVDVRAGASPFHRRIRAWGVR